VGEAAGEESDKRQEAPADSWRFAPFCPPLLLAYCWGQMAVLAAGGARDRPAGSLFPLASMTRSNFIHTIKINK